MAQFGAHYIFFLLLGERGIFDETFPANIVGELDIAKEIIVGLDKTINLFADIFF